MKMVELGKCCKIISGSTPSRNTPEFWDGDIHWFTPKDLSGLASKYVYEAPEKITKEGFKSCSTNLIPSNSLLFSSRAPIGHLAINKLECCTNQGFKTMIPSENLDVEYLYYAIKRIVPQLQDMGNGATFKELSKSIFEKVIIPLPPLSTQKKIAAILDAADSYRQKTKTLIDKYDQLAQSLFLDMFGDPVRNERGWETKVLEAICEVGSSRRVFVNELVNSGIPFYRGTEVGQLGNDEIINPSLFITKEHYEHLKSQTGVPKVGDLLMPSICPDGRIFRVVNEEPFYFKDGRVLWIKVNESNINSIYLKAILKVSFQSNYASIASGTTFAELKIIALKKIEILFPPLTIQNQFAERIQLIDQQKQQAQASLQKAEDLFNSLLQKAFKGELISE